MRRWVTVKRIVVLGATVFLLGIVTKLIMLFVIFDQLNINIAIITTGEFFCLFGVMMVGVGLVMLSIQKFNRCKTVDDDEMPSPLFPTTAEADVERIGPVAHWTSMCRDHKIGRKDFIASAPSKVTCKACRS